MATGYMILAPDFSTLNEIPVDATPGNTIDWAFSSGDGLPGPGHTGGHVGAPFTFWRSLVQACNVMVDRKLIEAGLHLVEITYTDPDDFSDGYLAAGTMAAPDHHPLKHADVVSEVDEATIRSTATVS